MSALDFSGIKQSWVTAEDSFMSEDPAEASTGRLALLLSRLKSSRGASLVEYALLVGLVAVVCIGAIAVLGRATEPAFTDVSNGFQNQN